MTDTNRVSLSIQEEATWGTTLSSGTTSAFKPLRTTGESLTFNISNSQSDETRSDRNVADMIRTDAATAGDLNFELSYGGEISTGVNHAFDDIIEGVMCSDWGAFSVGTPSLSVIKNGTTLKSYSIEKNFPDATDGKFQTFKGNRFDGMSLSLQAGSIITGSVSLQGKTVTVGESSLTSQAALAASATDVMNSINNVGTLTEGGSTLSDQVMSLSLQASNNLRTTQAIGTLGAARIGLGQFVVTGSMSVYFANKTLFEKFIAGTPSALSFRTSDADGNYYQFDLPSIEYTSGTVLAGSANADVMAELGFQAKFNATEAATMKITRYTAP
jgi:hypothetical protein